MSSQASISANQIFRTHRLVIPEDGLYLVMGEILAMGGNISLVIKEGDQSSGEAKISSWSSQNKCCFGIISRRAGDVLSLWVGPDSDQTFYPDGRNQNFFAIKLYSI